MKTVEVVVDTQQASTELLDRRWAFRSAEHGTQRDLLGEDSSEHKSLFKRWKKKIRIEFHGLRQRLLYFLDSGGLAMFFVVFFIPAILDLTWIVFYFQERQADVFQEGSACTVFNGTVSNPWETPRNTGIWLTQVIFSALALLFPFQFILTASSQNPFGTAFMVLVELLTSFTFLLSIAVISLRNIYVPTFLRIWLLIEKMKQILILFDLDDTQLDMGSFIMAFIAVIITVLGCFEYSQNNYPIADTAYEYACMGYADGLYWLIVTLSTVGYGDISPVNTLAKFVTMITIIFFLLVLPSSVDRLRIFSRRYRQRSKTHHRTEESTVIIIGHFNEQLTKWIWLFFNPVNIKRKATSTVSPANKDGPWTKLKLAESPNQWGFGCRHDRLILLNDEDWNPHVHDAGKRNKNFCVLKSTLDPTTPVSEADLKKLSLPNVSVLLLLPTIPKGANIAPPNVKRTIMEARAEIRNRDIFTIMTYIDVKLKSTQRVIMVLNHQANKCYMEDQLHRFNTTALDEQYRNGIGIPCNLNSSAVLFYIDTFLQSVFATSCSLPGFSTLLSLIALGDDVPMSTVHDLDNMSASKDVQTLCEDDDPMLVDELEPHNFTQHSIPRATCSCNISPERKQPMSQFVETLETLRIDDGNLFIGWEIKDLILHLQAHYHLTLLGVVSSQEAETLQLKIHFNKVVEKNDMLLVIGVRSSIAQLVTTSKVESHPIIPQHFKDNKASYLTLIDRRAPTELINESQAEESQERKPHDCDCDSACLDNEEAIKKCSGAQKHILFIGPVMSSIVYFLREIRRSNALKDHLVVWLLPRAPCAKLWGSLGDVGMVRWMLGDPTDAEYLIRAGILFASRLVFYSDPHHGLSDIGFKQDALALVVHRVVSGLIAKYSLHNLQLLFHLHSPASSRFIGEKIAVHRKETSENDDFKAFFSGQTWRAKAATDKRNTVIDALEGFWPMYMRQTFLSGQIWSVELFYTLLASTFCSGDGGLRLSLYRSLTDFVANDILQLIPVPPQFHLKSVRDLTRYWLLCENILVIGIFRRIGHGYHSKNRRVKLPAILINPSPTWVLHPCDSIYAILSPDGINTSRSF